VIPERLPVCLAVTLFVPLCFVTIYGIVIVARGRSPFSAHLAGRGVTVVNMAQVIACTSRRSLAEPLPAPGLPSAGQHGFIDPETAKKNNRGRL
jgi:hypothetical protein